MLSLGKMVSACSCMGFYKMYDWKMSSLIVSRAHAAKHEFIAQVISMEKNDLLMIMM